MQQYKKAIDVSTVVSITDAQGIITYVNDEFCRVMGYERSELIGQNHNVVRHPSVPESFFKEMWNTLHSLIVWRGHIHNKAKDGHSVYIDTTIVPIVDEHGKVIEYISFKHDVTEQVEQQRELEMMRLKDTEATIDKALNIGLTTLVSQMPVMVASSDEAGQIIQMSETMLEFFDGDDSKGLRAEVEAGSADLCSLLESALDGPCTVGGLDEIFMMVDDFSPYQLELTGSDGETRTVEIRYQSLSIDGALRYIIYLLGHTAEA
jgi:PAS domain S-box-containing protein